MESKKQSKDEKNTLIKTKERHSAPAECPADQEKYMRFERQFNFGPETEQGLRANISEQALENIKQIFNKTQTIRRAADERKVEIQAQFKELKERLNTSSECLNRMKRGIDNIKFSYQTKIFEMQRALTPPGDYFDQTDKPPQTKEEVAKQMDEIRDKIEKIQSQVYTEKEKQEKVMKNYQEAFENVSTVLHSIDKGEYSTVDWANIKDSQ